MSCNSCSSCNMQAKTVKWVDIPGKKRFLARIKKGSHTNLMRLHPALQRNAAISKQVAAEFRATGRSVPVTHPAFRARVRQIKAGM